MKKTPSIILIVCLFLSLFTYFNFDNHAHASDLFTWETVFYKKAEHLHGAACNDNIFVTVGARGKIKTSTDGVNWTERNSGTSNTLTDVTWNGSKFIAVGDNGTILFSLNGINWGNEYSGTTEDLKRVVWAHGKFVVAGNYGTILTSTGNGIWEAQSNYTNTIATFHDITWNNHSFFVLGGSYPWEPLVIAHYSIHSDSWIIHETDYDPSYNTIACNDNIIVIGGTNGKMLTADTNNPTLLYSFILDLEEKSSIEDIVWNETRFVAVGTEGIVCTSEDGITWTSKELDPISWFYKVIWDGSQFVIAGTGGYIYKSSDGTEWERYEIPTTSRICSMCYRGNEYVLTGPQELIIYLQGKNPSISSGGTQPIFYDIASNGERFVVVGYNIINLSPWFTGYRDLILTSEDGVNWTEVIPPDSSFFSQLQKVVWTGEIFIVSGSYEGILISEDGLNWNRLFVEDNVALTDVVYNGNQFVGIQEYSGKIFSSSDGVNWTVTTLLPDVQLENIIWNGSQFVIVGSNGTIFTSSDGINWNSRITGTEETLKKIVWNGQQFVVIGDKGIVLNSLDGVQWTTRNSKTIERLRAIIWTGNQFVAVGERGTIITSSDGENWFVRNSNTNNTLCDIQWNGRQFVAVGYGGTILTSYDACTWENISPYWYDTEEFYGMYTVAYNDHCFIVLGDKAILKAEVEPPATIENICFDSTDYNLGIGLSKTNRIMACYSNGAMKEITKDVIFQSSNPSVVVVDSSGVVSGLKEGTSEITAAYEGKTASITITVVPNGISFTNIELDSYQYTLTLNDTHQTVVKAVYSDQSFKTVTNFAEYQSSDSTIASINSSGLVKGLKEGNADIMVTYKDKTKVASVTVTSNTAFITGITLDSTSYQLQTGRTHQTVVKAVYSDNSLIDVTNYATYQSSNSTVATVNNKGLVTAKSKGSATITASYQGKSAQATITVHELTNHGSSEYNSKNDSSEDVLPAIIEIIQGNNITAKINRDRLDELIDETNPDYPVFNTSIQYTGNTVKLELPNDILDSLKKKNEETMIVVTTKEAVYTLPVKSINVNEAAEGLVANHKDLKVNLVIEKVQGEILQEAVNKAKMMGAVVVSNLYDFKVEAVAPNGKSKEIKNFNQYLSRTITMNSNIPETNLVGVMYNPTTKEIIPVPTVFEKGEGVTKATLKRYGNSMYCIIAYQKFFNDIGDHWAKEDIEKLASKMIVAGKTRSKFQPDAYISRADFAVMLIRALGLTENPQSANFIDVSDEWFAGAVGAAHEAGIINGYADGSFKPYKPITRQEMVTMILRAIEFTGNHKKVSNVDHILSRFHDNKEILDWAKEAVAAAVEAKIIIGNSQGNFAPNHNTTRAEAVVILNRMLQFIQFIN